MKKLLTLALILLSLFNVMGQNEDIKIPDGVVYKKTSEEINSNAKKLIEKELSNPEYVLFDKHFYCGPNLWNRYKELPEPSKIKKGNITFEIPQADGSTIYGNGKFIQSKDDYIIIWNQVIQDLKSSDIVIRKLNPDELQYFWHILFYDIEEPLFIIAANNHKIIVDISKDFKIVFLEETFD